MSPYEVWGHKDCVKPTESQGPSFLPHRRGCWKVIRKWSEKADDLRDKETGTQKYHVHSWLRLNLQHIYPGHQLCELLSSSIRASVSWVQGPLARSPDWCSSPRMPAVCWAGWGWVHSCSLGEGWLTRSLPKGRTGKASKRRFISKWEIVKLN